MVERAAAVKCPECGEKKIDSLASDETTLRYQCTALKCSHAWSVPRIGGGLSAALERDRERRNEEREATMAASEAGEKLTCPKGCGKDDFKTTRSRGAHARYCDGTAKPSRAKSDKPARLKRRESDQNKDGSRANSRRKTITSEAGGITQGILAMLQDKRIERIAVLTAGDEQLQEIDRLVEALGNPI